MLFEIRVVTGFRGRDRSMPSHARVTGGDSHASGRARQQLKLAAIAYNSARHGIDATLELVHTARLLFRRKAIEFVDTLPGALSKNRRADLLCPQGNSEMLEIVGMAYANARHGIDADVGMAREGLALLCQEAINYSESLPREDPSKRSASPHLQIGN